MTTSISNNRLSHYENQQRGEEIKPVLRSTIVRWSGAALLCLSIVVAHSAPARAFPIGGHPDKCPPSMPDGAFTCVDKGGSVACTNDGDVMCCTKNAQGGVDCEQIVAFTKPKAGVMERIPRGQLQVAPVNPAPKPSPFNKSGMNAPIMRRGIEGAPATTAPTGQEEKAPATK